MAKQQPNGWLNMLWVHFPSQPILIGLSNCMPHPPVHRLPGIRRIYIYTYCYIIYMNIYIYITYICICSCRIYIYLFIYLLMYYTSSLYRLHAQENISAISVAPNAICLFHVIPTSCVASETSSEFVPWKCGLHEISWLDIQSTWRVQ